MKNILTAGILGLTGLAGAVGAEANVGRDRRPEPARVHEFRDRGPREERRRLPSPRFERISVGGDACGKPVYRLVRVPDQLRPCDGVPTHSRRRGRRRIFFGRGGPRHCVAKSFLLSITQTDRRPRSKWTSSTSRCTA